MAALALGVVLAASMLLQAPGRIVADTKLDLYVDPLDLIRRGTRLWDGRPAFGYVPNQQWGYLFPMGPFFLVGRVLAVPTWLVQRAWLAAVVIVALLGVRRLARELRIGTPASRLVAAVSYALAPALLIHLAQTSAGIPLAMAALPWMVVPLPSALRWREPAGAAIVSAFAFTAAGSVNATVAVSLLPFPALFILSRSPGPRRRSLARWWTAAISVASLAFVVGVVLLGRYAFDFTKVTERASETTATVGATDVLRGTSDWLSYFDLGGPWSPAGDLFVHSVPVILATGLVTAIGLAGLARGDFPERRSVVVTFAIGVVGQAMAFRGIWAAPFASSVQSLLDGPLTPFRNVSKLAPLVALPIALGVAHQLGSVRRPRLRRLGLAAAIAAVGVTAVPVLGGRLFPDGSFTEVPSYWDEAAAVLAEDPSARTLVTPSMSFGEYTWGRTLDEPLQPLARAPWAARAIFPAGGAQPTTRLLDQLDAELAHGEAVPGLSDALGRAGVRYVLLRADLDRSRTGAAEPIVVASALEASAGLVHVRSFGPVVAVSPSADRLVSHLRSPLHALELYEVEGTPRLVSTLTSEVVRLSGGLESVLNPDVVAAVDGRAIVVDGDGDDVDGLRVVADVVSDGLRLRDRNFGDARGSLNASYVLGAGELPAASRRPVPLDLTAPTETLSVAGDGDAHIAASSSFGLLERFPEAQPAAAFDGDPWTSWLPGPATGDGTGEWIQASFAEPRSLVGTTVQLLNDVPWRPFVAEIEATTSNGTRRTTLVRSSGLQRIALPPGESTFLRLEIDDVEGFPGGSSQVGLSEVAIPGVDARRVLVVPEPPASARPSFLFERAAAPRLDPARWAEESRLARLFSTDAEAQFAISATAALRQPSYPADVARLTSWGPVTATASSWWFGRTVFSAVGALDDDPATSWIADPFDPAPAITVRWQEAQSLTAFRIVGSGPPTRLPTAVVVEIPGREPERRDLVDGVATIEPVRTAEVTLRIVDSQVDPAAASLVTPPAVGIRELSFDGVPVRFDRTIIPPSRCGAGPDLRLDDTTLRTRPVGTVAALLAGDDVPLEICAASEVTLDDGLHRIDDVGRGSFVLSRVALVPSEQPDDDGPKRTAVVDTWNDTARTVDVSAGPTTILAVSENFNPGWRATFAGETLTPLRLDGWRQAWIVPAGAEGTVTMDFAPTRWFRWGLWAWAGGFTTLAGAAWLSTRRRPCRHPDVTVRPLPPRAADLLAGASLLLTGGFAVLVLPVLRKLRRDQVVSSSLAGLSCAVATIAAAIGHRAMPGSSDGAFSGLAQLMSLLAVGAVLAATAIPSPPQPTGPPPALPEDQLHELPA